MESVSGEDKVRVSMNVSCMFEGPSSISGCGVVLITHVVGTSSIMVMGEKLCPVLGQ